MSALGRCTARPAALLALAASDRPIRIQCWSRGSHVIGAAVHPFAPGPLRAIAATVTGCVPEWAHGVVIRYRLTLTIEAAHVRAVLG